MHNYVLDIIQTNGLDDSGPGQLEGLNVIRRLYIGYCKSIR